MGVLEQLDRLAVRRYGKGHRWYHFQPFRALTLSRWAFMRKGWFPEHKRLARLRSLYWTLIRSYDSEICERCGHPVGLVFHAPDVVWETVTGFARSPDGEAAPGCLCILCVDALYEQKAPRGSAGFLRWTCSTDDAVMYG